MNNIVFFLLVAVFTCLFLYLFHLVKKGFKNPQNDESTDLSEEVKEKKTKPTLKKKK